ncbi:MAG: glycosyltransferase, partial [Rhodoglobus sp.]|nr:glycosyltransferase [Rhodoglobus sp.]
SMLHRMPHVHGVLLEQVKVTKPDVVFVQDINLLPPAVARQIRKHTRMLVGEIASPLPPKQFLLSYDLIVSALPSIVETAASWGLSSAGIPLGFDDRFATLSPASTRPIDAIFIGSFSRLQPQTGPLLQAVARAVPGLRIYGPADSEALREAGLTANYVGPAWGHEMFELLGQAKMVINRHGSVAGPYAVNMRMYEATGSGAALITEDKSNLGELFAEGDEVVVYGSVEDAAQQAAALLADPVRLDRIAAAGQSRTLRDHTYSRRSEQLAAVLDGRLAIAT